MGGLRLSRPAVALALAVAPALGAEPLPMDEVAPGVYVYGGVHEETAPSNAGAIANVGFIVGEAAVAVIDSGGSVAQGRRLREAVRRITDLPIRYVVNSHVHPDHVFGNAAFRADAPAFVGHAKLARALATRGGYYLGVLEDALGDGAAGSVVVAPTLTVEDTLSLDLGNRILRLTAHATAHTDNDLSVYDEATRTLWLGDLLFMQRIPVVDGSLKGWLGVLGRLRGIDAARVVPGHGPTSAPWPEALLAQERYLETLLAGLRSALANGRSMEQAVRSVAGSERGEWLLFDAYNPRNVVTGFTELEWE